MDITPMCGSPWLIAACHVLLRLLMPRHSPCALYSLTFVEAKSIPFWTPFGHPSLHSLASPLQVGPASLGSDLVRRFAPPLSLPTCVPSLRRYWFSQELCRPQIWFIVVFVLPYFKVHKLKLCYLSVACSQFLACFTVQFSRCKLQPSSRSD